jgi:hypothetical protein
MASLFQYAQFVPDLRDVDSVHMKAGGFVLQSSSGSGAGGRNKQDTLYATHDTFLKQRKVISCNGS